ncbi:MAG: hypothetical protein JJU11_16840 [Candidatus Sumerlaeia bacterium]|nr:hypothetical protein [Candidatus Sumerlaeia bacterium]
MGEPRDLLMVLLFLLPISAAASPTTGTLRLGDLFTASVVAEPWRGGDLSFDPGGAVVLVPDASAWRLPPPTPTPTPEPVWTPPPGVELPRFSILPNPELSFHVSLRQPAFEFRGLEFTRSFPGQAEVTIESAFTHLRVEYRLIPDGREEEALVLLHGPRSADKFRVPMGNWHLEWRAWRQEEPLHVIHRVYTSQQFVSTGQYLFQAPSGEETGLLLELRRASAR